MSNKVTGYVDNATVISEDEDENESAEVISYLLKAEIKSRRLIQMQTDFAKNFFRNSNCGDTMNHINPFLRVVNLSNIITSPSNLPIITCQHCETKANNGISGLAVSIATANDLFNLHKSSEVNYADLISDSKCISQINFGIFHINTVFASIDEIIENGMPERYLSGVEVPFIVGSYPSLFMNRDFIPMLKLKEFAYRKVGKSFCLVRIDTKVRREYQIPIIDWIMTKHFSKSNNYIHKLSYPPISWAK